MKVLSIVPIQITLTKSFEVADTSCECVVGQLAKCHHVACVLYHIHKTMSCTDAPCSWLKKKDVDRGTISKLIEILVLKWKCVSLISYVICLQLSRPCVTPPRKSVLLK